MADLEWVAICCYRNRRIARTRCADCQPEYGCLGFRSSTEVLHFNELIPASMLGAPLPLNLWPRLWKTVEPSAVESSVDDPTPVRLLVAALGLECVASKSAHRAAGDLA